MQYSFTFRPLRCIRQLIPHPAPLAFGQRQALLNQLLQIGTDASGIKACGLLGIAGGDHASGAEQIRDRGEGTVGAC
jgi:hypothetical protein